jgi:NifB/MoaA-like Fe-S oxidoreductase
MGIHVHTQLVLCPGANDGAEMDRSIRELAALRPMVESISVVPVGLTKYNNMISVEKLPPLRSFTVEESRAVVDLVEGWQRQFAAEPGARGLPFVYLSDEWYYTTRRPFPPARHYGDYAQIENGVGMTRKLLEEWRREKAALAEQSAGAQPGGRRVAILTSAMATPVMRRIGRDIARATGLETRVIPVENQLFGAIVTVAGLLGGRDILDTIARELPDFGPDDLILAPRVSLDNPGVRFLDDVTLVEFREQAPAPVIFARTAAELRAGVGTLLMAPAVLVGD